MDRAFLLLTLPPPSGSKAWQGAICSGDEGRTITYDAGDRMASHQTRISVSGGARVEDRTYWYDGLGRRILTRSVDTLASDYGFTRHWWLDANVAVKTFNLLSDPDLWWPSLTRHSNGVSLIGEGEWFYSGPDADEHLGSWNYNRDVTRRHLFIADYRGSVVRVMKPDGVALGLSASTYAAFGAGENAPASAAKNPGYNGLESSGGLVYMRNRWYDPNAGRFTQEDPIGFAGGINLYGYVGNDPISYSDPFGLSPDCDFTTGEGCSDEVKRLVKDDKPLESPKVDPVALVAGGVAGRVAGALSGAVRSAEMTAIRAQVAIQNTKVGSYVIGFTESVAKNEVPGGSVLPLPAPLNPEMAMGQRHGDMFSKIVLKPLKELLK